MTSRNEPQTLPAAIVRQLDQTTIEEVGIPGLLLMENAGQAAAFAAAKFMRAEGLSRAVCLAGKGNNAGDAFVVARHLVNAGFEAEVILAANRDDFASDSDAGLNLGYAESSDVRVKDLDLKNLGAQMDRAAIGPALLVDGLLGTGIKGAAKGAIASVIRAANASNQPILALDLPSGLNADSGEAPNPTITAAVTLTFGVAKPGLVQGDGPKQAGMVEVARISIPKRLIDRAIADQNSST